MAGIVPLPGQPGDNYLDGLKPLFRILVTVFVAGMGMFLCGVIGSLAYPIAGVGAIFGSIIGFILFLCFGCCLTGAWRDFGPKDTRTFEGQMKALMPHALALNAGFHGKFQMIVTIHEVKNVHMQFKLPWSRMDTYVELECGKNPVKRTCVKMDGIFNEQFKIEVRAVDESVLFRVRNQDVFGSTDLGYACVDIQHDIIDKSFPCAQEYPIEAGAGDKMRFDENAASVIVLSFDVTEDYPVPIDNQAVTAEKRHYRDANLDTEWNSANYGTVNFLSQLEFNPALRLSHAKDNLRPLTSADVV